jgi:uncharacterized protein (DUF983 family)
MTQTLNYVGASSRGEPSRDIGPAIRRGFSGHCPRCGEGKMFRAYLKVADHCPVCGEDLSHQRADDAPAYLTMLIVGHFIVAGILSAEDFWPNSSIWLVAFLACALATLASLWLLPRIKGALIGYQWAMRMHGFGGPEKEFI